MAGLRFVMGVLPGLLLCVALAEAGRWLAAALVLPVPGAVIGLGVYLVLLLGLGDRMGWSRAGGQLLLRWLGALLIAPLVALEGRMMLLVGSAGPLLLLLFITTLATALATAALYRLAGGGEP